MKNLILVAVMGISLIACNTAIDKKESGSIDLVKNYVKAVENLDFNAMDLFLDDNYLGMGPSYADSIGKEEAIANWKWSVENLYENIRYNRSRYANVIIPDGDNIGEWVANWSDLTITYKNGLDSVKIIANTNYLVKDGKIIRSLTFYNEADVLRQLAYELLPSGEWE